MKCGELEEEKKRSRLIVSSATCLRTGRDRRDQ
jgi:hypothetical protein